MWVINEAKLASLAWEDLKTEKSWVQSLVTQVTGILKHSLGLFCTTVQIGRDVIGDLAQPALWGCILKASGYHIAL